MVNYSSSRGKISYATMRSIFVQMACMYTLLMERLCSQYKWRPELEVVEQHQAGEAAWITTRSHSLGQYAMGRSSLYWSVVVEPYEIRNPSAAHGHILEIQSWQRKNLRISLLPPKVIACYSLILSVPGTSISSHMCLRNILRHLGIECSSTCALGGKLAALKRIAA
jgi:hypothetical protein